MENLPGQMSIYEALEREAHAGAASHIREMRLRLLADLYAERFGVDAHTATAMASRALRDRSDGDRGPS